MLKASCSICAVHGLNGNAFDTWVADSNNRATMWLRDLLPASVPFNKARIMTFGYSSQLSDRRNLSGIHDWSHQLLECLSNVRLSEKVNAAGRSVTKRANPCFKGEESADIVCVPFSRWNCSPTGACMPSWKMCAGNWRLSKL